MGEEIDIADHVGRGVVVVVATRDWERRPELARAWGPALSDDGGQLTVCVDAPPGSAMARNLASGSPAAATLARLSTQTTIQLKGPVVALAAPTPARLAAVRGHVDDFVAETAAVGVPEAVARSLVGEDLVTVTIAVDAASDDTPGTGEGRPL